MKRYAAVLIFLSIYFIITSSCNELKRKSNAKHESFIRGTYHAWWVILGVDTSSAIQMLHGMYMLTNNWQNFVKFFYFLQFLISANKSFYI